MNKVALLKRLGCLRRSRTEFAMDGMRSYFHWRGSNPLVWLIFLGYTVKSIAVGLVKIIRAPWISFRAQRHQEFVPSPTAAPPRFGDWYYYPYFNGYSYVPCPKRYAGSVDDERRLLDETYCRTHYDCDALCRRINVMSNNATDVYE